MRATNSAGCRFTLWAIWGACFSAALILGASGHSRGLAQDAAPRAAGPDKTERHEIELLRRKVADLEELVRKLQADLAAQKADPKPPIELLPIRPAAIPSQGRAEVLLPEEPRGHLLFPIHIERANYPAPRALRKQIDDAAPPREAIRPFPMRP